MLKWAVIEILDNDNPLQTHTKKKQKKKEKKSPAQ